MRATIYARHRREATTSAELTDTLALADLWNRCKSSCRPPHFKPLGP